MTDPTGSDHSLWEEMASMNALGMLQGADLAQWAKHRQDCEACQREECQMLELAAQLASVAPVAPRPTGLRERLFARIETVVEETAIQKASRNSIIRAEEGEWTLTPFPGVDVRTLSSNPETGDVTSMVRMAPGAVYAPHRHAGDEHCYVLSGDLIFEDHTLGTGDYSVNPAGTTHSRSTSKQGCLLLVMHNVRDQILASAATA